MRTALPEPTASCTDETTRSTAQAPPGPPGGPASQTGSVPAICGPFDSQSQQPAAEPGYFGLTGRDQIVCAGATAIMLLGLAVAQSRRQYIAVDRPQDRLQSSVHRQMGVHWRVDINSAGWAEFCLLERIGPILARRIILDRRLHGPYVSVDNLQRVPGIGPRTIQQNRERLTVTSPSLLRHGKSPAHAAEFY